MNSSLNINIIGEAWVYDNDTNELIEHKQNHVHTKNFNVILARAITNMKNGNIYQMAFGNGGHNDSNVIRPPNTNDWNSTLYNEVYSEIVDVTSGEIGGGVGSVPAYDPPSVPFTSGPGCTVVEQDGYSLITCTCVLNQHEPKGQINEIGNVAPVDNYFAIDEIGLFTSGLPVLATKGYQDVDLGGVTINSAPGLTPNIQYGFGMTVNNRNYNIVFNTPNITAVPITMTDLQVTLNNVFLTNSIPVTVKLSDYGNLADPVNTYGFLRFESTTTGTSSNVRIFKSTVLNSPPYLISSLAGVVMQPVDGTNNGLRISPTTPETESRRMLTHLILDNKIQKGSNKSYKIVYRLKISTTNS